MWYRISQNSLFLKNLKSLTPNFVQAAQEIYDEWDEHPDKYFGGGICHLIADAFAEIVYKYFPHYTATTYTRDDIQHVETIVYNIHSDDLYDEDEEDTDIETVIIDLSPYLYESGGGFTWKKIPNVQFNNDDISFYKTTTKRSYIDEQ